MSQNIVGLIPAAGQAKRISPLPGSKELFPIGFKEVHIDGHIQVQPKVISQYLIDSMFTAGASKIWMVLGRGKWDIMQYYGDGQKFGGPIAYLLMERLWGMPYTLDLVYPWLDNEIVIFGMPDTIFTPKDVFEKLLNRFRAMQVDVVLGIFPTNAPEKLCPVKMDDTGRVIDMSDKPSEPLIHNSWGCACWSKNFSEFMHKHLNAHTPTQQEITLAQVFRAAIKNGIVIHGLLFSEGEYIDIGTSDDLAFAVRLFSGR